MPQTALVSSTQTPEQVLTALEIFLPPVRQEELSQLRLVGEMLYTPAVLPRWGGEIRYSGAVNAGISIRVASGAARLCAHNLISLVREEVGSLDSVRQVMQVNVLVRCSPGFENVSRVADGASEAFFEVFGAHGRHRRAVLATTELPEAAPVQVAAIFRVASA